MAEDTAANGRIEKKLDSLMEKVEGLHVDIVEIRERTNAHIVWRETWERTRPLTCPLRDEIAEAVTTVKDACAGVKQLTATVDALEETVKDHATRLTVAKWIWRGFVVTIGLAGVAIGILVGLHVL